MLMWLKDNLINIALIAAIALTVGLLIRVMVRDRKAGKSPCGGSCASCGACRGCSACARCCPGGTGWKEKNAKGVSAGR